jgi:hypothetical protein
MENAKLEFPEVVGQVVSELTIYDDPISGQEVLVRFSDGTQLSICINIRQAVDARYYKDDTPDMPIFIRGQ